MCNVLGHYKSIDFAEREREETLKRLQESLIMKRTSHNKQASKMFQPLDSERKEANSTP